MDRALQRAAPLILLAACRVQPYSAEELAAAPRPERALVRYLAQAGADPAVCDPTHRGAAIPHAPPSAVASVARAGRAGKIPAQRVADCLLGLWRGEPGPTREAAQGALLDAIVGAARGAPDDFVAFAGALARIPEGAPLDPALAQAAAQKLRRVEGKTTPELRPHLAAALDALDATAGTWRGEPVTAATIAAQTDEALLLRWARALPVSSGQRALAGARLLDLRLAHSSYPTVRANPEAARAAVLADGQLTAPADARLARMTWDTPLGGATLLRVHQNPRKGELLLVLSNEARQDQADPSVDLRAGLSVDVHGWPAPIGLCPPADPYDPTPCWPAERLQLAHPFAWLDGARLKVRGELDLAGLIRLSTEGGQLRPQVVSGGAIVEIPLGIHFEPVTPMEWSASRPVQTGPALRVVVTELGNGRLLYEVQPPDGEAMKAVVPLQDVRFYVASIGGKGAEGAAGARGAAGAAGAAGSNARCPDQRATPGGDGTDGGDGADGGAGGMGGAGGPIHVVLRCGNCDALEAVVHRTVRSEGGEGGEGGRGGAGGPGGAGGRGGASASCEGGMLTAAFNGSAGPNGKPGRKGPKGPPGLPGKVTVKIERDKAR